MVSIIFSMARSPPALDTLFLDALRTAISSKFCGACVYTLTSLGGKGARGKPVSVCDDVWHPAIVGISAIVKINPFAMHAQFLMPEIRYFGGVSFAAGAGAAGATSPLVVRFVNRHPSLVLMRLSV